MKTEKLEYVVTLEDDRTFYATDMVSGLRIKWQECIGKFIEGLHRNRTLIHAKWGANQ